MTRKTHDVLETLKKLPEICFSYSHTNGQPIGIKRGEMGYYPIDPPYDVDFMNKKLEVTPQQFCAMEIGSMMGWEVPGADPDSHKPDKAAVWYDASMKRGRPA